jgi:hypothetical protein
VSTVSLRLLKAEEIAVGANLKGGLMNFRAGREAMDKKIVLQQAGIEPPFLGRVALSQVLFRLSR